MPLHEHDELKLLTVPDGVDEAVGDATAVANGEEAAPASPSFQEIFTNAPSDLRRSFEDLKGVVHQHTGTHNLLSSFLSIYVVINAS